MVESKVREKEFDLHTWFATIPMTDDVYLGLQAQNLARVEMNVMRLWETEALDEQEIDPGNYQGPKCRELMALSQMWVFGLYEFMRTWRQRARLLMQFEEAFAKLATQQERDAYLAKIVEKAKDKARLATRFPVSYAEHVARVSDPQFMKSIRDYLQNTERLYGELSAVRMPAAKHELPKQHGQEALIADAPGMGLPDRLTGSICWRVLFGEKQTPIMRRDLADKFFGIYGWHEDVQTAARLASEAKARRKRQPREAKRDTGTSARTHSLDQFFRTEDEAKHDDQTFTLSQTQGQDRRHGNLRRRDRKEFRAKAKTPERKSPSADAYIPAQEAPREPLPYFVKKVGADS